MTSGYTTARLDELERLTAFGEDGVWHPVRHHFGIEGFGINAYTADRAGGQVVEEHDELAEADEGRHEELYVVLSGRATFALGADTIDAPSGTFVFVKDPALRRGAIAVEPHTTVLAIGARPGHAFHVSPWEYAFRGRARWSSDGVAIFEEGMVRFPQNATLPYNLACLHALAGEQQAALAALSRSIALDPVARTWASAEEDFASLRGHAEFDALLAG
jgi:hypothetical protein